MLMKKELIENNKILQWENRKQKEEIERLIISLQAQEELTMNEHIKVERLNNIIKEIRNQLDYLETYSSREDVFEDMSRRLNKIESIIGSDKE